MNRLALLFATTACALVAPGCTASPPPAPPVTLEDKLTEPFNKLLSTNLSTPEKFSAVDNGTLWINFDSTFKRASEDCTGGINVALGDASQEGDKAEAVVIISCGEQAPNWFDKPSVFILDDGDWKLTADAFRSFTELLAEPM